MADTLRNISGMDAADQMALARDRWKIAETVTRNQRLRELDDRRFVSGDQWPSDIKSIREREGLPCLVMNRVQGSVSRVANEARQLRPMIRITPVDSSADPETARILQGIIRHAEVQSHSDDAYETATISAAIGGRGFFQLYTTRNHRTLYEELRFRRIRNPLRVRPDPYANELDYSDMNWCFVTTRMSRREFATRWPDAEANLQSFVSGDEEEWITPDFVRVAEYYYREIVRVERARLPDGTTIDVEPEGNETQEQAQERIDALKGERFTVDMPKVWHQHINGFQVLDEAPFPADWIPIIPILGEEIDVDGDVHYSGVTRAAKDPQRYYNYNKSSIAATISLAPKAPFVMAEGQQQGYERMWSEANRNMSPYLLYKPLTHEGHLAPPPQRQVFEPPIQALVQETLMAADDIKATTRVFDAALGARSNETSGRAIAQRGAESELSNAHFADNQARAIEHAGRIALQVVQAIYTEPQVLRILGDNDEEELVRVNQLFTENGEAKEFRLNAGEYDVIAKAGPNYKTQREETVGTMIDLTRAYPDLFQFIGDIILRNMDAPFSKEAAERFKKTIPPEMLADGAGLPPEEMLQLQLQRATQMIEQLNAFSEQQEEQIGVLRQAFQALQQQLDDKTRDLDRKDRELALKAEISRGELDVKQDAQILDEDEFALKVSQEASNGQSV